MNHYVSHKYNNICDLQPSVYIVITDLWVSLQDNH